MKIATLALGIILMSSLPVVATTISTMKFNEISLHHEEALKLGVKSELTNTLDKRKLYEFRVAVPERIKGNKINHVSAEIFNSEENIASFSMSHYSTEKPSSLIFFSSSERQEQSYYYVPVNPKVVKKVVLNIFCENKNIYIVEEIL